MGQLASLGTYGRWLQNVERDLHAWIRKNTFLNMELSWIRIPIRRRAGRKYKMMRRVWVDHPVLRPADLASAMFMSSSEQWKTSMLGFAAERGLREFWTRAKDLPWATDHWAFRDSTLWNHLVGYRTHGDAARCQKRLSNPQKLLTVGWQSSTTRGCAWDTRFVYTVIPEHLMIKDGDPAQRTIHFILHEFVESLKELESGVFAGEAVRYGPQKKPLPLWKGRAGQRIAGQC